MKSSSSTDGVLSRSASSIARSETLGASVSESCSTGVDGGNCAGRAIGGTLSISSALLSGKINDGATGRGCTGAAAGGALIGCSCGNTSGAAGVVLSTGRRSPFRRRLTVGYSTGSALVALSGASICQEFAASRARIEIDGLITKWHRSSDRTAVAERRRLDSAERRRNQMVAPALRHARLLRQQRGEILISDRRRHQRQEERTEPEGRRCGTHHPNTRRSHYPLPQRLQRNAHVVIETRRVWRECDGFIYCRVNVANALIA